MVAGRMSSERFNVVLVWEDGYWEYFLRDIPARRAVEAARRCTQGLLKRSDLQKVMITDEDDCTNFLWERGKGLVYPTREELAATKNPGG